MLRLKLCEKPAEPLVLKPAACVRFYSVISPLKPPHVPPPHVTALDGRTMQQKRQAICAAIARLAPKQPSIGPQPVHACHRTDREETAPVLKEWSLFEASDGSQGRVAWASDCAAPQSSCYNRRFLRPRRRMLRAAF